MEVKNFIGRNEHAKFYEVDGKAVKVFEKEYPKSSVFYEAFVYSKVEETGLPISNIYEISLFEGSWAITKDKIPGKCLYNMMKEDPANLDNYLNKLLDIQLLIHTKTSPFLYKLKDKLSAQIVALTCISDPVKYELMTRLNSMPKHDKLCHGSFDPLDVFIDGENFRIANWLNATRGNASADIANTYLILTLQFSEATAEKYIDMFCQKTGTSKKYVYDWLPIVAAVKLAENKPEEMELLHKWTNISDFE